MKKNNRLVDMRQRSTNFLNENWFSCLFILFTALLIFYRMSPLHKQRAGMVYVLPVTCSVVVLMLHNMRGRIPRALKVLLVLMDWMVVSTILNGDKYLTDNGLYLLDLLICMIIGFPVIPFLQKGKREKSFDLLSIIYIVMITVLSLLSIYAALFSTPIYSPFSIEPIWIAGNGQLRVFGYHHNIISGYTCIATFLCSYLYFKSTKIWEKIACFILILMTYIVNILTVSRTVMVLFSLGMAVSIFVLVLFKQKREVNKYSVKRIFAAFLSAIVTALLLFLSFTPMTEALSSLTEKLAARDAHYAIEQTVARVLSPTVALAEAPIKPIADSAQAPTATKVPTVKTRDFLGGRAESLNGRTMIWKAGLNYLKDHPQALLTGVMKSGIEGAAGYEQIGFHIYHMHNGPLQVLMVCGIPGLLLILYFLFLVLKASVRLFFAKEMKIQYRYLALLPVVLLVFATVENFPLASGEVVDIMFYMICGAVVTLEHDIRTKTIAA